MSFLTDLFNAPFAFDFHAVMRRLETTFRSAPRWGESVRPSDEPIRLGQDAEMSFPPTAVRGFLPPTAERPGRLSVAFFGLFGPMGPLPLHLTEYARERARHGGDRTLASFIDLFHHRMLTLFHRAWSRAQPTASRDRAGADRFGIYLASLMGMGLPGQWEQVAESLPFGLQYAGHFVTPTRHPDGLVSMINHYFRVPVAVEEFVGQWLDIPADARMQLGRSPEVSTLGRTTILGARVFGSQHKFRLVLGPLRRAEYERMLPGGVGLQRLTAMVRSYVGQELDWDLRLILEPKEHDRAVLGRAGRLGWTTRIGPRRAARPEDLIVHPDTQRTERLRSSRRERSAEPHHPSSAAALHTSSA